MRNYDLISTVFLMVLGIYVSLSGFKLGFGDWHEPGSGFLAVLSGSLLFLLSVLWLTMIPLKKEGPETSRRFFKESDSLKKVSLTLLGLVGYTLILRYIGFMFSSLFLMVFLFKAIEPQRWRLTLIMAVTVTLFCVILFQIWLQVQFPEGPLSLYKIKKWIF